MARSRARGTVAFLVVRLSGSESRDDLRSHLLASVLVCVGLCDWCPASSRLGARSTMSDDRPPRGGNARATSVLPSATAECNMLHSLDVSPLHLPFHSYSVRGTMRSLTFISLSTDCIERDMQSYVPRFVCQLCPKTCTSMRTCELCLAICSYGHAHIGIPGMAYLSV